MLNVSLFRHSTSKAGFSLLQNAGVICLPDPVKRLHDAF